MDAQKLMQVVDADKDRIVKTLCDMLRIKAVGPENGGAGEAERGDFLVALLKELGFDEVEQYDSKDPRVPSGRRPNIVARVKGSTDVNLWVVTHTDIVPEGDLKAWTRPPYEPQVVDGRIYGRGSEDNGQELIASLFGLVALLKTGITPEFNVCLAFVSDEEYGNTHGIDVLLKKGLFKEGDLIVVPDHGYPDGASMAIVEKSVVWVKVVVVGRQTHGSTPANGVNAFEVAARYIGHCTDRLRSKFSKSDPLFDPPESTFVPSKCEGNDYNINTVPGRQVFYCDFRVLPDYALDDIMSEMQTVARELEAKSGAKIEVSFIDRTESAGRTSEDAEVVKRLGEAITVVGGFLPKPIGIGGATFATPFRKAGLDAVAWSTIPGTGHDANEYIEISGMMFDAKTYAVLFAGKNIDRTG
ncbi:MAG: M20 family metallo-hydrolase [Candidatus Thermoplasmatota archaeon]|nr:M20 family metallo-hydrolase [Candidatus Thermoplasmatota archaeon]